MGLALPSASPAWNTPETTHSTQGVEPYGPEAAAYGRILRYVILASGENFNATLIRDRYARGAWDIRSRRWPLQRAWGWYRIISDSTLVSCRAASVLLESRPRCYRRQWSGKTGNRAGRGCSL